MEAELRRFKEGDILDGGGNPCGRFVQTDLEVRFNVHNFELGMLGWSRPGMRVRVRMRMRVGVGVRVRMRVLNFRCDANSGHNQGHRQERSSRIHFGETISCHDHGTRGRIDRLSPTQTNNFNATKMNGNQSLQQARAAPNITRHTSTTL